MMRSPQGWARARSVLRVALIALLAAYLVPTAGPAGAPDGFRTAIDGWLQCAVYLPPAALCALQVRLSPRYSWLWGWLAAGLSARALGFVLFVAVVRGQGPPPYPSVADAAWLLSALCFVVGLARLTGRDSAPISATVVLDATRCAAATAAVLTALFYDDLVGGVTGGQPARVVTTNLAYPVLDLTILTTLLLGLVRFRWQPPPFVWVLAGGVAGFAVTDVVFLVEVSNGTFSPGSWLSALSAVSTAAIAWSPWAGEESREPVVGATLPNQLVPAFFATLCWAVLAIGALGSVPPVAVVLASIGLLASFVRTALTFGLVRRADQDRHEARTDDLTGLPNRRAFFETLEAALADRSPDSPFSVVMVDLSNLPQVNQSAGRLVGDEVLRRAGVRLVDGVATDDTVARIGMSDFALLLSGADRDGAADVVERVHATLRGALQVTGHQVDVLPVTGTATFPEDGTDPLSLLHCAELAMTNHRPGPGVVPLQAGSALRRTPGARRTVDRLRLAIDRGEIIAHYQPVVELGTGRVVGLEALARWRRTSSGEVVFPDTFLPVVEAGGLMPQLTRAVLAQALQQVAQWRAGGADVSVGVNLSVTNLLEADFPDGVDELLDRAGVPGSALRLELTEDLFLADPGRAHTAIAALARREVRLLIDDYGTGYSNLRYVREFPDVAGLKLDRSFVTTLDADPRAEAIVRSTLTLADSLGLDVVAEGVETPAGRDVLEGLGCRLAQGYLFSRPVPADQVPLGVITPAT